MRIAVVRCGEARGPAFQFRKIKMVVETKVRTHGEQLLSTAYGRLP